MYKKSNIQPVYIIAELHPQHGGDMKHIQTMILQAKMGGADAVKVQLYDTMKLHGDSLRKYVQISKDELRSLKSYSDNLGIEFFASSFDLERFNWGEECQFKYHKIASRSVKDVSFCRTVIASGKPVFISLGMHDWKREGFPFDNDNVIYFFCRADYPAMLEDVAMPTFDDSRFDGYSDHSIGIGACIYAVARGARYIEKHFTTNKDAFSKTERGHAGAMDFDELRTLRRLSDSIAILRSNSISTTMAPRSVV